MFVHIIKLVNLVKYFVDWGLGIGDWAQSPIPNPQSPIILIILLSLITLNYDIKYVIK